MAENIDIDKLQIEISASSADAAKQIQSLADEMERLKKVLGGNWKNPIKKIKPSGGDGKARKQSGGLEPQTSEAEDARSEAAIVQKMTFLDMLKARWDETRASLREKAKLNIDSKDADTAAKRVGILQWTIESLKKTFSSIKRISFYRAIRSVIRSITIAFSEGLENAYRFSLVTGGELADALDRVATASAQMKNQLGAALGTLLVQLEPLLVRLIGLVTQFAQSLTWMFAVLSGADTYLVANEIATSWKEADKAAKSYRRTLLGIDEINRLNEQNGGGTLTNFEDLFHREAVDYMSPNAQFLVKLKDVLFKWDDFTPEFVATKVLSAVFGAAGGIIGWTLGGPIGGLIGLTVGAALGVKISDVLFNGDGNLNSEEIASLVMVAVFGVSGGVIGWAIGGPIGAAVGLTIGVGVSLAIQNVLFKNDGKVTLDEVISSFVAVLGAIGGGIIGFAVGGPLGAAIGVAVGTGVTLLLKKALFGEGGASKEVIMDTLINALTVAGGGLLGFALGGPLGAVVGISLGVGTSMLIKSALFGKGDKNLKDTVMGSLAVALNGVIGGLIGFAVGGPVGAALGATIGVAVKLIANSVDFSSIKANVSSALDSIKSMVTKTNINPTRNGGFGSTGGIGAYATGGFPEDGLFFANRHELIGQFSNGRTAVANNEQITEGIADAVYNAFMSAFSATGNNDNRPIEIYLDGKQIATSTTKYQRQYARATGV